MSSDARLDDDLARAARRAASHGSGLVAGLTSAWQRAFPDDHLEDVLGCSSRVITELSLCLRPRSEQWAADVQEIAEAVGVESHRMEAFFRKAEIAERLSIAHSSDEAADGRLMAARDRDEDTQ